MTTIQMWQRQLGPKLWAERRLDAFTVPPSEVTTWASEEKLSYVARLLRSLAATYGVSTDYWDCDALLVSEEQGNSPAALLRGLNDILWMP